ncbi:MAG: hypothetical protein GY777_24530 [Candidatus Brocadiaceae bacterium]|nr:hypothetical protein [Candidatus Brocadiaceae bacterium]
MKQSYWCYLPIILIIFLGFALGGYLSFGVMYLKAFPFLTDNYARTIVALFGIGMLGVSTYCAKAWANDIDEVVYKEPDYLPHFFDFFGYMTLIVGGGITGVILYFLVKTGVGVSVSSTSEVNLTKEASVIIAYMGGLYHFRVQEQLGKVINKLFKKSKKTDQQQGV